MGFQEFLDPGGEQATLVQHGAQRAGESGQDQRRGLGSRHDGVRRAARTIAVLSDDHTRSVYGQAEWQAAWTADPSGAAHAPRDAGS
ncbi:hypothetical protein [Frankia sp. EAN1pec]|uniref:hypothetical protein n=1 Tax=Parafrankia sp. (strain EAN1pec) TaxID=298653 RepID=UPI000674F23F